MSPRGWLRLLPRLWSSWITLLGSVIVLTAGVAIGLFLLIDLFAPGKNAYTGALAVVVGPMLMALGVALVVGGLWWDARRRRAPDAVQSAWSATLADRSARARIVFVAVTTLVSVGVIGWAAQGTIRVMDSPSFCGGACHSVMQPQLDAFRVSPHARIDCVECHIGESSYLKAKLNGVEQMFKVMRRSYHKPATMPVERLLSSKQTCERCHSARWFGNQLRVYPHFKPDRDNTPVYNALMLHVGGLDARGKWQGMHAHADPALEIRYQFLDEARSRIGRIDVFREKQLVASYLSPGATAKPLGERTMDCVDCHNRPTHIFDGSPKDAIDRAMGAGLLDKSVPFLAQIGTELLARPDARRDDAEAFFRRELRDTYWREHTEFAAVGHQLDAPAKALADLYRLNVYPAMKLGWGTYRSQLAHGENNGCFRCHDNAHADAKGKTLGQDCDQCHERIALDEDPKNFDDTLKLALPSKK